MLEVTAASLRKSRKDPDAMAHAGSVRASRPVTDWAGDEGQRR
jgi:hypothetical protein